MQLGTKSSEDRLRVLKAGADYDFADQHNGVNRFAAELSKGVGLFNGTDNGNNFKTRADGQSDFAKLTINASRTQQLTDHKKWSLHSAVMGQWAADPLLASEECGVGGEQFGRAYDASEITGDHCVMASAELRYLPEIKKEAAKHLKYAQLYGYYDVGAVYQRQSTVARQSAASAGFGVRFSLANNLSGLAELTKPLTRIVSGEGDDSARAFFKLTANF